MPKTSDQSTPLTRRVAMRLGAVLAATGIVTSQFGPFAAEARRKKRKKKAKIRKYFLEAPELSGENEVGGGDPDAAGSAACVIKSKGNKHQICCAIDLTTAPTSPISGVHIHKGPPGADGPIVIDFDGQLDACVGIGKGLVNEIKADPTGFYLNVHTDAFPAGAIREQLLQPVKG